MTVSRLPRDKLRVGIVSVDLMDARCAHAIQPTNVRITDFYPLYATLLTPYEWKNHNFKFAFFEFCVK